MKKKENLILLIYAALLTVTKILVFHNTPLWIFIGAENDDELMYKMAQSLSNGEWLGPYSNNTLVKGLFFPLFLAFNHKIGISFLDAQTLFYAFACLLFVVACKKMINNNWLLGIMYTFLFFIPASLSRGTFQRPYRSGIVLSQTLIIFASIIALFYLALNKESIKKWIPWAIALSLSLVSMNFTREDAFWIMPFVIVASIVIYFCNSESRSFKLNLFYYKHIILLVLPFFLLFVAKFGISVTNYKYYGIYTVSDLSGTNFANCLQLMYSIDDPAEAPRVSVSREKMNVLYSVSPTLSSEKEFIETALDAWKTDEETGNVMDGWFFWAFRDALFNAGYYESATKADEFYKNVCVELQQAINNGTLNTHPTMPSTLMSPWRDQYKNELWKYVKVSHEVVYTNEAQAIWGDEAISEGDYDKVKEHAEYLNGRAIFNLGENNITDETIINNQLNFITKANKVARIGTKLFKVYQKLGSLIYYVSIICFIYIIVSCIFDLKENKYDKIPIILIIIGMVLSYLLILIGISYTHISAYDAIHTLRLAYAYPVFSAIEMIAILVCAKDLIDFITSHLCTKDHI